MRGHMNMPLTEAAIPYIDLVRWTEIDPHMPQCDVLGANLAMQLSGGSGRH